MFFHSPISQAGASRIFAIDINPDKFPIAMEWGATECLNPKVRQEGCCEYWLWAHAQKVRQGQRFECLIFSWDPH